MCLTFPFLPPNFPKPPVGKKKRRRKKEKKEVSAPSHQLGGSGLENKWNPDRYAVPVI